LSESNEKVDPFQWDIFYWVFFTEGNWTHVFLCRKTNFFFNISLSRTHVHSRLNMCGGDPGDPRGDTFDKGDWNYYDERWAWTIWTFEVWSCWTGTVLIARISASSRTSHADEMRARTWGDGDSPPFDRYPVLRIDHVHIAIIFIKAVDRSREQYNGHEVMLNIVQTERGIVHILRDKRKCLFRSQLCLVWKYSKRLHSLITEVIEQVNVAVML
jgi:hypothetical protein